MSTDSLTEGCAMVAHFLRKKEYVPQPGEVKKIYEKIYYTRELYTSFLRLMIPTVLFLTEKIIKNYTFPHQEIVTGGIVVMAIVVAIYYLCRMADMVIKMPDLNGPATGAEDMAREIEKKINEFRQLMGKYPQDMGREKIRNFLTREAKKPKAARLEEIFTVAQELVRLDSHR